MKNIKGSPERQTGFTLIELMIALVVISLVICGYVGANVMAQRNTEEMHERTIAIQDANRVIEQMRDTARTGDFPDDVVALYPDESQMDEDDFNDLTDEQVTVTYASTTANPLNVTVTVTWTSYAGRQHTETVETYITQR